MPRPISYAVFCLKKKNGRRQHGGGPHAGSGTRGRVARPVHHRPLAPAPEVHHVRGGALLIRLRLRRFFFSRSGAPRDLHSFPTRRSSDLAYLFATMIMTSVSSPFSCCSGIVRLNLM